MSNNQLHLQNQLLIAMPGMLDDRFAKTVSIIARHNQEGCLGLVINQPTETSLAHLLEHLKIPHAKGSFQRVSVFNGGPVQPEQGFVLHNTDREWENTLKIAENLWLTTSRDILESIADDDGPEKFMICLGCASWVGGQVEGELLDNAWLTCDSDNDIIFDQPVENRWYAASESLGIDVRLLSDVAGHA